MYTLTSDSLEVSILDPVADQERFGTRYCTGGYIFQITDRRHGALLSGPTYPDSFNWFDGQGIPDAFNLSPLREPAAADAGALIIGVGVCDLQANRVAEFCRGMFSSTRQRWPCILHRRSRALRWSWIAPSRCMGARFAPPRRCAIPASCRSRSAGFHIPFFPHVETDELCRLNIPVSIPADASYQLAESGFIARKGWPWTDGHFLALDHAAQNAVVVLQKHPLLGLVAATCSYIPSYFPIWGNPQTFSWEPFLERTIGAGQEFGWWIDYDF